MREVDLMKISKCIGKILFINDADNILMYKMESVKLTKKEKKLMKEFLKLGEMNTDTFIKMIKENKELDDYDFINGAKNLIKDYEELKDKYDNYKIQEYYNDEEEWANNMCKID